jgi:hypothetical protein
LFSLNSGEAKSQRAWRASFAAVLLRPFARETQALRMPLVSRRSSIAFRMLCAVVTQRCKRPAIPFLNPAV